jgi:hypothetical protein
MKYSAKLKPETINAYRSSMQTHCRDDLWRADMRCYVFDDFEVDNMPFDTFVVELRLDGTERPGRYMGRVCCVTKSPHPVSLLNGYSTSAGRALHCCWRSGMSVRSWEDTRAAGINARYNHIIFPWEPGHDLITAFSVLCDTRRGAAGRPKRTAPDLLIKGLQAHGVQPLGFDLPDASAILQMGGESTA